MTILTDFESFVTTATKRLDFTDSVLTKGRSLNDRYLHMIVTRGVYERYKEITDELRNRITYELYVIFRSGFSGYFLVNYDLIRFCRESGISVGPGRGSVCGSAVAYALYTTDVDPIRWGIPFERFLHLDRISMPDIDTDICKDRRGEAIQYLRDRYGMDNVTQIITFGTLMAKGIVRDVGRGLHVDDHLYGKPGNKFCEDLAAMIPDGSGADQIKLAEFIESPGGQIFHEKIKDVEIPYCGRMVSLLDTCLRLEGLTKHSSVHAAGVVIAPRPIKELAPIYRRNQQSEPAIIYDYKDAEELGLLKLDVLGLRTVSVLGEASELIRQRDPSFDLRMVPLDDENTFALLRSGDTVGVFQLEGEGITNALTGVAPDSFDDIVATIALYRPGPMEQLESYVHRKHGKEDVAYDHKDLIPILEKTYGLIIYQEQVMGIARTMADFSPGEADMFRKAIGKKLPKLIAEQIEIFTTRAVERGYNLSLVESIGNTIAYFGRYSFNMAHATGYGFITYWTAYLKSNYPLEFFTASLNSYIGDVNRIATIARNARNHKIKLVSPDINRSGRGFTPDQDGGNILFGLGAIRGLGESVVEDILAERDERYKRAYKRRTIDKVKQDGTPYKASEKYFERIRNRTRGPFKGVWDFCRRCGSIPINVKLALAGAGAFGTDPTERAILQAVLKELNVAAKKDKPYDLPTIDEAGPLPMELEILQWEYELMGFYVSKDPLALYRYALDASGAATEGDFKKFKFKRRLVVAGMVIEVRKHQAKNGEMAWVKIQSGVANLPELTVFNSTWKDCSIEEGDIVIATGKRTSDPRYGDGFTVDAINKIRRKSFISTKSILISIGKEPTTTDFDQLLDYTHTSGRAVVYLAYVDNRKMALVRTGRFLKITESSLDELQDQGWQIKLGYKSRDRQIPWRDGFVVPDRDTNLSNPIWEQPLTKRVCSILDAKVITELKQP